MVFRLLRHVQSVFHAEILRAQRRLEPEIGRQLGGKIGSPFCARARAQLDTGCRVQTLAIAKVEQPKTRETNAKTNTCLEKQMVRTLSTRQTISKQRTNANVSRASTISDTAPPLAGFLRGRRPADAAPRISVSGLARHK